MTIDEAIAKEKANAEKLRKIIETGYDGGISIEAFFVMIQPQLKKHMKGLKIVPKNTNSVQSGWKN